MIEKKGSDIYILNSSEIYDEYLVDLLLTLNKHLSAYVYHSIFLFIKWISLYVENSGKSSNIYILRRKGFSFPGKIVQSNNIN